MKLQACSKCGAQFDVSSFAPGQKFTCGSCGAVLTAHVGQQPAGKAPGARTPGGAAAARAPARGRTPGQGRTPGKTPAAKGGAARRGPQYTPPERHAEAKKPGRPAQRAAKGGRTGREKRGRAPAREQKKGPNPALIYGAGGLIVVAVLAFLLFGTGSGDGKGGEKANGRNPGTGPSALNTSTVEPETQKKPDTVASVKAELAEEAPTKASQYEAFAKRLLALGADGRAEAKKVYEQLIKKVDPNHVAARKFLGYTDFQTDILERELEDPTDPFPEIIANRRGYPYLNAVMEFNAKRWLIDEDVIEDARTAVGLMREHADKLANDHNFRAGDQIRANIANNHLLRDLNYETYWAEPYLVVYSSSETLSELDLRKIPDKKERKKKREELREKRKTWKNILREKAAIFQSTYNEWMRRYGERFGLKSLTAPYGGRPDYKPGDRSYPDGVPLVIWIFTDGEAFRKHHREVMGMNLPAGVGGYFTPATGWIFLFDEGDNPDRRTYEINKTVHEGVHQLEYWFTRQRSKWGFPKPSQDAFSEGIAEYLGSVQMQKDRTLKFIDVNVPRIGELNMTKKGLENSGQEYKLFPVKDLVKFSSYNQAVQWAQANWGLGGAAMGLLYQQAWAFTYFMHHYKNGKYKENWLKYFDAVLDRQTGLTMNQPVFMRAFGIRDDDEWDELQEEWETYFNDVILEMAKDTSKWKYRPPGRTDPWGDEDKDE